MKLLMHPVFIPTIITTERLLNLQKTKFIQADCSQDWYSGRGFICHFIERGGG